MWKVANLRAGNIGLTEAEKRGYPSYEKCKAIYNWICGYGSFAIEQSSETPTVKEKSNSKQPVIPEIKTLLEVGLNESDAEFVIETLEKYRKTETAKLSVYRTIVSKFGKKTGTDIYNKVKPLLENYK